MEVNFKTRLYEELEQLEERLDRLNKFLGSEDFNEIEEVQQELLKVQANAMLTYIQCLLSRIEKLN